ncbi:MAG TPA: YidB family protein [Wenzhouxiangellaceae bacterium]|nr:YidB family protein [Wenzhouxiangellaceae bacterium]
MDINQILKIGAQAFQSQLDEQLAGSLSLDKIMDALAGLMPGEGKDVDLGALVGRMQGGGLASLAESWLSDGGNAGIGADQLMSMFGSGDIMRFADKLGLDEDTALEGLKGAVPEMVDKASTGGTLESLGGIGSVMGMAGKLFGR